MIISCIFSHLPLAAKTIGTYIARFRVTRPTQTFSSLITRLEFFYSRAPVHINFLYIVCTSDTQNILDWKKSLHKLKVSYKNRIFNRVRPVLFSPIPSRKWYSVRHERLSIKRDKLIRSSMVFYCFWNIAGLKKKEKGIPTDRPYCLGTFVTLNTHFFGPYSSKFRHLLGYFFRNIRK